MLFSRNKTGIDSNSPADLPCGQALHVLAPHGSKPPFAIAQVIVLFVFLWAECWP
ncbi:MAG: hypothetical protein WCE51_13950 [Chthoniobacterales bacterium]